MEKTTLMEVVSKMFGDKAGVEESAKELKIEEKRALEITRVEAEPIGPMAIWF